MLAKDLIILIDFDSTFVRIESLDRLAEIALEDRPDKDKIIQRINDITNQGMEGKIGFRQSLKTRLQLFRPDKQHIEKLVHELKDQISPSLAVNKSFFDQHSDQIYIFSGGFSDYILPVVRDYGIAADHVLANKFLFDNQGRLTGYDEQNPLSQDEGKVKMVKSQKFSGRVFVVGDGYNDYQIRASGLAEGFIAYTENIRRESVVAKADLVVDNFGQVIERLS